jgi:hypothetical protein
MPPALRPPGHAQRRSAHRPGRSRLLFKQPFGINALVGLIALSGILMRNTLILIGQIRHNEQKGHSMLSSRPPCSAPVRSF